MQTTTVAGRTWDFSHAIGTAASSGAGFSQPIAIAVGPGGELYVMNRGYEGGGHSSIPRSKRISKLTLDEELIGEFALQELTWGAGLAIDRAGNVYASDEYGNFIAVYDPDGQRLGQWGEAGSEEGRLNGPSGLALDAEDNLYVVDSLNDRVQKFTKDGSFLLGWGSSGDGEGQFNRPWGITLDRKGDVYVADWGNDRVQKFSADGTYLMSFGSSNGDGGELRHPPDVAVDTEGDVYVTDWGGMRVQIYDAEGSILTALHGDAHEFSKWAKGVVESNPDVIKAYRRMKDLTPLARFERPVGLAVDSEDRIFVTDSTRSRLQIYAKVDDFLEPQFNL